MAITISQEPKRSRDSVEVFFVAIDNGMWFEFEATGAGSPLVYESKCRVDLYLADNTKVNVNDIVLFFGIDNKVFFDASPYIQTYLNNDNDNTYQSAVETDANASQGFYLKYGEFPVPSPDDVATSSTYYASKSAKQYGDTYGQNMASYWASSSQVVLAKLLTKQKNLPYWSGFPFSVSYIKSDYVDGANITQLDNGGSELSNVDYPALTNDTIEQVNVLSINASTKKVNISLYNTPPQVNTYSMLFDGVDEIFNGGDIFDKEYNEAFSVSCWVKFTSFSGNGGIVARFYNSGWQFLINTAGKIIWGVADTSVSGRMVITVNSLSLNTWYNIVVTKDTSDTIAGLKVYIDGASVSLSTLLNNRAGTTLNPNAEFWIGGRGGVLGSQGEMAGYIDEAAFWESELSSVDATTIYNSGVPASLDALSPVGWWRMGEEGVWASNIWTLTDQGSGANNVLSENMEEVDRSTDVPT